LAAWAYRRHLDPDRPIDGQFYNVNSTAFRIQVALFREFSESVRQSGAKPLVLMLPDEQSIQRARQGGLPVYEPLLVYMRAHSIDYVDAGEAFREASVDSPRGTSYWFAPGGHYSREGNELVAAWLAKTVRSRGKAREGEVRRSHR
jgi:hypothetical protein